jgi:aryl sulfotransferase
LLWVAETVVRIGPRNWSSMGEERTERPSPEATTSQLFHYTSPDEDSARWWDFPFRAGDIVVSTRSKSGTTWAQMICLLLVFQSPELPERLGHLSPWLDHLVRPKEAVFARLAAQAHRRVIKTHTPLDGVPLDDRATYIVVGRHPLDVAVSLYHHAENIDRRRMAELTGVPETPRPPRPPLHEWLRGFVDWEGNPREWLDTLPGAMLHLSDAWARRQRANVVLVHYDELSGDLNGTMRRLAARLGTDVDEARWPSLVEAATFRSMRASSRTNAPDTLGVLKDPVAFFRNGVSGEGRALLSAGELDHYHARVASLAPADLLAWLHGGHGKGTAPNDWPGPSRPA